MQVLPKQLKIINQLEQVDTPISSILLEQYELLVDRLNSTKLQKKAETCIPYEFRDLDKIRLLRIKVDILRTRLRYHKNLINLYLWTLEVNFSTEGTISFLKQKNKELFLNKLNKRGFICHHNALAYKSNQKLIHYLGKNN